MPAKPAAVSMPPAPAPRPGFELVARLTPDDWMRLEELVEEDG
jgi:hypothetical protein